MTQLRNKFWPWHSVLFAMAFSFVLLPEAAQAKDDAQANLPTHREIVLAAIDKHILPRIHVFSTKAKALSGAVAEYCQAPAPRDDTAVMASFKDAVISWAAVATDRIGPARKRDRSTRISFWPDPRGIVNRQLRRVMNKRDPELLEPGAIAKRSVAIQGLPALENLLFNTRPNETPELAKYKCDLAIRVAENIALQADEMKAGWLGENGWRQLMLTPGPDNHIYKTELDAANEVIRSYMTAMQIIRDSQILPWIKAVEKSRKSALLPFERTGLSKQYLASQYQSVAELHEAIGLVAFADALAAKNEKKAWMANWLRIAFKTMLRQTGKLELPAVAASNDAESKVQLAPLRQLKFYTSGLRQIVGREIVPMAGLFLGFNELDGD